MVHGSINGGWERWEEFVQKAEAGENANIEIIQCTIEGDFFGV